MMKIWELEYSCAAHSNRKVRFSASSFQEALINARELLSSPHTEHGPHGGYEHSKSIVRLDYVTDFEQVR